MPQRIHSLAVLLLTLALLPLAAGCPNKPVETSNGDNHDDVGGHAHSHSHAEGPAGGHLLVLGDEKYHVEWLHDDEDGRLTMYILDAAAKEKVPIDAEELIVKLTTKADGQEVSREVKIPGVERSDDGTTAKFELVDKSAIVNIVEGKDVAAVLMVPIGEETFEAEIEHEPHGHSHSH